MAVERQQIDPRTRQALAALRSDHCACGHHKRSEESFCRQCYHSLPAPMRSNLYATLRNGYVDFYFEAVDWLTKYTGRTPKAKEQA